MNGRCARLIYARRHKNVGIITDNHHTVFQTWKTPKHILLSIATTIGPELLSHHRVWALQDTGFRLRSSWRLQHRQYLSRCSPENQLRSGNLSFQGRVGEGSQCVSHWTPINSLNIVQEILGMRCHRDNRSSSYLFLLSIDARRIRFRDIRPTLS